MVQEPINRYLDDKAMDRIDHALGRPLDPTAETYRNFYTTDGDLADEMATSPFWREGRRGRDLRSFCVTDEGREALAAHLRKIGDPHRAFVVTFDGHHRTVVAASRDKAKYSYFSDLRDVLPDLTFKDYCRRASVRRADLGSPGPPPGEGAPDPSPLTAPSPRPGSGNQVCPGGLAS